jgi:hypothetical protein
MFPPVTFFLEDPTRHLGHVASARGSQAAAKSTDPLSATDQIKGIIDAARCSLLQSVRRPFSMVAVKRLSTRAAYATACASIEGGERKLFVGGITRGCARFAPLAPGYHLSPRWGFGLARSSRRVLRYGAASRTSSLFFLWRKCLSGNGVRAFTENNVIYLNI